MVALLVVAAVASGARYWRDWRIHSVRIAPGVMSAGKGSSVLARAADAALYATLEGAAGSDPPH